MAEPRFDATTGRWYIRIRTPEGGRVKKLLPKHPGWKKLDRQPRTVPADVLSYARPYQDMDAQARIGLPIDLPSRTPLPRFLESYLESIRLGGHATGTLRIAAIDFRQFLDFCRTRNVETIQAVSPAVCREFLEAGARVGKKASTLARKKGLLSPAFNRAVHDGLIPRNPWDRLAVPGKRKTEESPFWTEDETDRIAAQLKGWIRDFFLVGIHSGFRIEGLQNMRWRDVIWSDPKAPVGSLWCRVAKGDKPYRIPLFPKLREVLTNRKAAIGPTRPDDLIFPGQGGNPVCRDTVDDHIERAMKRAGVKDRGRRCHAMRETFGTRCGAKGIHPRTLMQWMNHSSLKQTMKYLHYDISGEASEVAKLGI